MTSASAPFVAPEPPQPARRATTSVAAKTTLMRKRLDAEEAALHLRVGGEGARGGLGRDLAADHDQLPIRERGCDAEVLLDQQDAQPLLLEPPEDLDQVLDDRRSETFGRLVHDQELRVRQQRSA